MPTNIEKFNAELERLSKKLPEDSIRDFQMMVTLEAFRRIVMRTPVDTGRARGNWQIGIDVEPQGEVENFEDPTIREMVNVMNVRPYSTTYITNNVSYIYYLEYDRRSPKSPDGMVEITLHELTHEFQNYS